MFIINRCQRHILRCVNRTDLTKCAWWLENVRSVCRAPWLSLVESGSLAEDPENRDEGRAMGTWIMRATLREEHCAMRRNSRIAYSWTHNQIDRDVWSQLVRIRWLFGNGVRSWFIERAVRARGGVALKTRVRSARETCEGTDRRSAPLRKH